MIAVVGHVEWVELAVVDHPPAGGEIVFAGGPTWSVPAGGGAVSAVHLHRLCGGATFFTSIGADAVGDRTLEALRAFGLDVHAARPDVPQRRQWAHLDAAGERAITVLGAPHTPRGDDDLPWELLAGADAVYVVAGDAAVLRHARAARTLVAGARVGPALAEAGVELDVLVGSAADPDEPVPELSPPPRAVVLTEGERGGAWTTSGGGAGRWAATPLPGPAVDAYGCGDAFAAGLTHGLARGADLPGAIDAGARAGAACLALRGPYGAR